MIENIEKRECPIPEKRAGLLRALQNRECLLLEQRALGRTCIPCAQGSFPVGQPSVCTGIAWPSLHCLVGIRAEDQNKEMVLWLLL